MKSLEEYVQGLYQALIADISDRLDAGEHTPAPRKDMDRDILRLCSYMRTRGLAFFTLDLVEAGKHFDRCLSLERLTAFPVPGFGPRKRGSVIPRLFQGLMLRVFSDSGALKSDVCFSSVQGLRQLFYAVKKLRKECEDGRTFREIEKFYVVDRDCRRPSLDWQGSDFCAEKARALSLCDQDSYLDSAQAHLDFSEVEMGIPPSEPLPCLRHIQQVADILMAELGVFNPLEWKAKHGPGAVSDKVGNSKYDFPNWPARLEEAFPMADLAFANYGLWAEAQSNDSLVGQKSHEAMSVLHAVPKTQKSPRLIAAEPISHLWCQQTIWDFVRTRSAETTLGRFVHFRDQSHNQRAALRGSADGYLATIDLSAASDRLSCWVVERVFRRNKSLLHALYASRTRWLENKLDAKSPRYKTLRKFATAGSACTFPVQSIVFLCIALGCVLWDTGQRVTLKNMKSWAGEVLVFGDDIIVPSHAGYITTAALSALGFRVNADKTFLDGSFRESCGLEAFKGYEVTPTYFLSVPSRSRPESIVSSVASRNNFAKQGYYGTADYILSTVREEMPFLALPMVRMDSGIFGLVDPFGLDVDHLRKRWNVKLQKFQVQVHTLKAVSARIPDRGDSSLLQYFTEAPSPEVFWKAGVEERPRLNLRTRWVGLEELGD